MSDAPETPNPAEQRAAYLAAEPSTTYEALLFEGPGVFAVFRHNYPERAAQLEAAHYSWKSAGKPAGMVRTAPVATAPTPRPVPEDPYMTMPVPHPSEVKSLRDLVKQGAGVFTAFYRQYPERFEELRQASQSTPISHGR